MRPVSLKLKIGIFLGITLTVAMLLFTVLVVRHNRQELLQEATGHVNQLSEVITRSTRFALIGFVLLPGLPWIDTGDGENGASTPVGRRMRGRKLGL